MATRRQRRNGNILVLTVFLMIGLLAMLAFSLDLGYAYVARTQMQRSADSAALAAAWELVDEAVLYGPNGSSDTEVRARAKANEYAQINNVLLKSASLEGEDFKLGFIANPSDPDSPFVENSGVRPNAVRVRLRKTQQQNGEVPFSFAPVLGRDFVEMQTEATAVMYSNLGGFRIPHDGSNLSILPFTLDDLTWDALIGGAGDDNWTWNDELKQVQPGGDGIAEVNLYPHGDGPPGNRGTVDIGGSNNSTDDIKRQIVDGISPSDLEHHGGKLEFDENGDLDLNGDTGISAAVKDKLNQIRGKPRIIPIFRQVQGPGNNAQYIIVKFVGVRVLDVKLQGGMSSKRVIIQPCNITTKGGIPKPGTEHSHFVYSPAWLVR